jgi:hypothetical protein
MPYNYLVDPKLRRTVADVQWCAAMQQHALLPTLRRRHMPRRKSAVLLFDEAHNLVRIPAWRRG